MSAFKKGHKKLGGKTKGTPNKRTQQWGLFSEYCLNSGLKKFEEEMNKLKGKDFIYAFINLLEFHKPKLARVDNHNTGSVTVVTKVIHHKPCE